MLPNELFKDANTRADWKAHPRPKATDTAKEMEESGSESEEEDDGDDDDE